jgi:hypothetical protein
MREYLFENGREFVQHKDEKQKNWIWLSEYRQFSGNEGD